jgi:hypothetical protein
MGLSPVKSSAVEPSAAEPSAVVSSAVARRFLRADLINSLILVLVSVVFIAWYFPRYYVPRPVPTNPHFGAAVTAAFGEGLKDPILESQSKLAGFLNHSVPSSLKFDDVTHPMRAEEVSPYQRQHLYLMALVGLCWRVFGVDWAALGPLVGLMAALSVLSVYGILRSRVRPVVALIGSVALLACPTQLALANYVRDYAKTPFFLMVFFLFCILLTKSLSASRLMLVGVALGLVTGIGLGIRQEIQIVWVVIPFLYLFGLPTGLRRMPFARLGSLLLAFGLFQLLSYPVRNDRQKYAAHGVLGGSFKYNHDSMGMGGAPYIWFNEVTMTDNYTNTVIQDYNRRLAGKRVDVQYLGTEYESAGKALVVDLVRSFPADFVTRFFAASLTTIRDAPWLTIGALPTMYEVDNTLIARAQQTEVGVRQFWNRFGPWLVFLGLVMVSWHSLRVALFLTGLLIFFTGYTSLQFQPRHLWHLGVIFVCASAFLFDEVLRLFGMLRGGLTSFRAVALNKAGMRGVVLYLVLVPLSALGLVGGTRLYQSYSVGEMYRKYATAKLVPSTIVGDVASSSGSRTIEVSPAPPQGDVDVRFRYEVMYHALTFEGKGPLPTEVRVYDENLDLIKVQELAGVGAQGPATIFFPAHYRSTGMKVEIKGGDPDAKVLFSTVGNPDDFLVPMVLVLPQSVPNLATHQVFIPQKRFGM